MKVRLHILAKDLRLDNYYDSDNCPVTKALARAGYPSFYDYASRICAEIGEDVPIIVTPKGYDSKFINDIMEDYIKNGVEPQDFDFEVEFLDAQLEYIQQFND